MKKTARNGLGWHLRYPKAAGSWRKNLGNKEKSKSHMASKTEHRHPITNLHPLWRRSATVLRMCPNTIGLFLTCSRFGSPRWGSHLPTTSGLGAMGTRVGMGRKHFVSFSSCRKHGAILPSVTLHVREITEWEWGEQSRGEAALSCKTDPSHRGPKQG